MTNLWNIELMWKFVIIAVALVISGCATVDTASRQESDAEFDKAVAAHNETSEKKEKLVCRFEKTTGSNFREKVCRTVAQMERDREEARKTLSRSSTAKGLDDR